MKFVVILWAAFVARGVYYCQQQPMWEGLDEWAHFAALQYFADHGHMPARTDPVSDEVVRSLELTPLPWSNNGWIRELSTTTISTASLSPSVSTVSNPLHQLTATYHRPEGPTQKQYEGQQPPLYYAL